MLVQYLEILLHVTIGDTLPLLLSLDAVIKIQTKNTLKIIPLDKFLFLTEKQN